MAVAVAAVAAAWTAIAAGAATIATALTFGAGLMAGISAWTTVVMVGMGAALLLNPPKLPSQGQQVNIQMAGPDHPVPLIVGRTGTQGIITYRGTYGNNNDSLLVEHVLSVGPVDAIESFSVLGRSLTYSGNPANGMATVTQVQGVDMRKSKLFRYDGLRVGFRTGSHTDTATLSQITGESIPFISGSDNMPGLARTILRCKLDEKRLNFPNGYPDDPISVVRGVKCWDPRLDSTQTQIGGSGPHRRTDIATHTWSENPFIVGLNFALGWWTPSGEKTFGLGADIDMIDVASFVSAANVADANNWKVGGLVSSQDSEWQIITNILASGGGIPTDRAGKLSCFIRSPKIATFTLREADVIGSRKVATSTPISQRVNRIVPSCRQENQKWEMIAGEAVADPSWLAQDNGVVRTQEIALPLVNSMPQAHQLAAYYACESREFLEFEVSAKPRALAVDVGDCIEVELPEFQAGQTFIVMSRKWDPQTSQVTLSLKAETLAKHAFALGQTQEAPAPPTLVRFDPNAPAGPGLNDWAVVANQVAQNDGGVTGAVVPALVVVGEVKDPNVQKVLVEYRQPITQADVWPGGTPGDLTSQEIADEMADFGWSAGAEVSRTATEVTLSPMRAQTEFEVSVRYETVTGAFSERLILNPVTTALDRAGGVAPGVIDWDPTDPDSPIIGVPPVLTDLDPNGRLWSDGVAISGEANRTATEAFTAIQEAQVGFDGALASANGLIAGLEENKAAVSTVTSLTTKVDLKNRTFVQTSQPTNPSNSLPLVVNDLWMDSDDNNRIHRWNGSTWVLNHDARGGDALSELVTARGGSPSLSAKIGTISGTIADALAGKATAFDLATLTGEITTARGGQTSLNLRFNAVETTANGAATAIQLSNLSSRVDTRNRTFRASSAPSNPSGGYALVAGDIWIDTANNNAINWWTGSAWSVSADSRIATNATNITNVNARFGSLATTVSDALAGKASAVDFTTLNSEVVTARGGASSLNSRLNTVESTANGAATASSVTVLQAAVTSPAISANPNFTAWTGAQPEGWTTYGSLAGGNSMSKVAGQGGNLNAWRQTGVSGSNIGIQQNIANTTPGGEWIWLDVDLTLVSGSLVGAGLYFNQRNASGSVTATTFNFATQADATGVVRGAGVAGSTYRFRALIDGRGTNVNQYQVYGMTRWAGLVSTVNATIDWHRLTVRSATADEVALRQANSGAGLDARITQTATVAADITGRVEGTAGMTVNAGGQVAAMLIHAEDGTDTPSSTIDFLAGTFGIWNPTASSSEKVFEARNGGIRAKAATIDRLNATTSITVGTAQLKVAVQPFDLSVTDGQTVSFGYDLGYNPSLSFNALNLAPLTAGEAYSLYADSLTPTGFIARLKIATPGTPSTVSQGPTGYSSDGVRPFYFTLSGTPVSNNVQVRVTGIVGSYFYNDAYTPGGPIGVGESYSDGYMQVAIWAFNGSSWAQIDVIGVSPSYRSHADAPGFYNDAFDISQAITVSSNITRVGISKAYETYPSSISNLRLTYQVAGSTGTRTATPSGQASIVTVRPRT